jgi:4-hydroxy-2-oxoheptanedioate aldolase
MPLAANAFKRAIAERQAKIGLWLGLADAYSAEICAGAGFDWLVVDAEHSPNDVRSVLAHLQALAAYPVEPVVRPAIGDEVLIKQYLDIGARTLLAPMVEYAEQASALVAATRYPPQGIRGMALGLARAARWSTIQDYATKANEQICLLVQIETVTALDSLESIAAIEGVDGLFIGPSDLSASLGYPGNPSHPAVQSTIDEAIGRILRTGKAAGILAADEIRARQCLALGCSFVAVGSDIGLLSRATRRLAETFQNQAAVAGPPGSAY